MKKVGKGFLSRNKAALLVSGSPISREPQPYRSQAKALSDKSDGHFTLFHVSLNRFSEQNKNVHIMAYKQI